MELGAVNIHSFAVLTGKLKVIVLCHFNLKLNCVFVTHGRLLFAIHGYPSLELPYTGNLSGLWRQEFVYKHVVV